MKVSNYINFSKKLEDRELIEVLSDIKSNKYESEINSIRYAIHSEKLDQAGKIKNGLLGFTTSGTFGASRTKANIVSYSQILGLDFDDIPLKEINKIKSLINRCVYTYASFISPSGEGLKVFIKIN
ncbi:MAG: hypothetical protein H7239_08470 [Flavobacterium sp.]|nr:hypothetical protein [Flavobacterium sp.]